MTSRDFNLHFLLPTDVAACLISSLIFLAPTLFILIIPGRICLRGSPGGETEETLSTEFEEEGATCRRKR